MMWFWVETKKTQIMVYYDVILMVHSFSKVSKITFASNAENVHCRLIKVISNDLLTQVFYPYLIHCFASTPSQTELLTNNDFCVTTSS